MGFETSVKTMKSVYLSCYHDRFPMGFETLSAVLWRWQKLTIMIGSLWDLKLPLFASFSNVLLGYHDRFPMGFETNHFLFDESPTFCAIMIASLWDLKL